MAIGLHSTLEILPVDPAFIQPTMTPEDWAALEREMDADLDFQEKPASTTRDVESGVAAIMCDRQLTVKDVLQASPGLLAGIGVFT